MDTPISHFMTESVNTVVTMDTVERVEEFVTLGGMPSVPVVDAAGRIFGIISSQDLLRFHATRKNPKIVRAWELCTYKPIEVTPATSAAEVARLMIENKIHQVIVSDNGSICGFVSSLDFVRQFMLEGGTSIPT